uniref:Uncharacterized protein n=1 Tax=Anopheles atroparvus TaxID=41427 RepID=A0A182JG25_ANOAO
MGFRGCRCVEIEIKVGRGGMLGGTGGCQLCRVSQLRRQLRRKVGGGRRDHGHEGGHNRRVRRLREVAPDEAKPPPPDADPKPAEELLVVRVVACRFIDGRPLPATAPPPAAVALPVTAEQLELEELLLLLLAPSTIGVTASPPDPTNGANLPLSALPTVPARFAATPPRATPAFSCLAAASAAASLLFGIRSYSSVPSGAFGGFGNATTSGFGMLSFGVSTNQSPTVAPGLPRRFAMWVTLPRSFLRKLLAPYLCGRWLFIPPPVTPGVPALAAPAATSALTLTGVPTPSGPELATIVRSSSISLPGLRFFSDTGDAVLPLFCVAAGSISPLSANLDATLRPPKKNPRKVLYCRLLTKSFLISLKSLPYFSSASSNRFASEALHSSISSRHSTGPLDGTSEHIAVSIE